MSDSSDIENYPAEFRRIRDDRAWRAERHIPDHAGERLQSLLRRVELDLIDPAYGDLFEMIGSLSVDPNGGVAIVVPPVQFDTFVLGPTKEVRHGRTGVRGHGGQSTRDNRPILDPLGSDLSESFRHEGAG